MARTILWCGAALWLLAGIAGIGLAVAGRDWLLHALPPLAIGAEALGGAVSAFSVGLLLVAVAHVATLIGLQRAAAWSYSAAILLAGVLAAALLTLAVAALTSAAAEPAGAPALIGSALGVTVIAAGYALAAGRLVAEMRGRRVP